MGILRILSPAQGCFKGGKRGKEREISFHHDRSCLEERKTPTPHPTGYSRCHSNPETPIGKGSALKLLPQESPPLKGASCRRGPPLATPPTPSISPGGGIFLAPPPIEARPHFPDGRHPGYSPCWTWRRFRYGLGRTTVENSEAVRSRRPVGFLVFPSAAGFLLPPPPGEFHSPPLPSTSRHAELDEPKRRREAAAKGELAEAHAHNGNAMFVKPLKDRPGARLLLPANRVSISLMASPGKEEAAPCREEEATAGLGRFSTG